MSEREPDLLSTLLMLPFTAFFFWLAYEGAPISLICLGAGLLALFLAAGAPKPDDPPPRGFADALFVGLLRDGSHMALWFFVATAIVTVTQVLLNLFRARVSPDALKTVELAIYDVAQFFRNFLSLRNALICLGTALLLSLLLNAAWPVTALRRLRRGVAAGLALFGALTAFTFVTTEVAEGKIRAAIVRDLEKAAQARREHAALQWIAADLKREQASGPEAAEAWTDYFQTELSSCRQGPLAGGVAGGSECDPTRLSSVASYSIDPTRPTRVMLADAPWLPDFAGSVRRSPTPPSDPPSAESRIRPSYEESGYAPLALAEPASGLGDLFRLRLRAERAKRESEGARDLVREVVVEGMAGLLGDDLRGVAGDFVDNLRVLTFDVLASHVLDRLRRGREIGTIRLPRLLRRPAVSREVRYAPVVETAGQTEPAVAPGGAPADGAAAPGTSALAGRESVVSSPYGSATAPGLLRQEVLVFTPPTTFQPLPTIVPVYLPPVTTGSLRPVVVRGR